jgi:hypothetical protein
MSAQLLAHLPPTLKRSRYLPILLTSGILILPLSLSFLSPPPFARNLYVADAGGVNLSGYHGKESPADTLPLTVHQIDYFGSNEKLGWRYPRSSSCKLKDAESLKFHYGAERVGEQGTCRQWNEKLLARVLDSVPEEKRESLVFDEDTIIIDEDVTDFAGPIWVESLDTDYGPNTIYLNAEDGKLHIRSAASVVARNNPLPFLGKEGTFYAILLPFYCHFNPQGQTKKAHFTAIYRLLNTSSRLYLVTYHRAVTKMFCSACHFALKNRVSQLCNTPFHQLLNNNMFTLQCSA